MALVNGTPPITAGVVNVPRFQQSVDVPSNVLGFISKKELSTLNTFYPSQPTFTEPRPNRQGRSRKVLRPTITFDGKVFIAKHEGRPGRVFGSNEKEAESVVGRWHMLSVEVRLHQANEPTKIFMQRLITSTSRERHSVNIARLMRRSS